MGRSNTQLAVAHAQPEGLQFSNEQRTLIREQICGKQNLSDGEFELFIAVAARLNMDPLKRQIYAIKRGGAVTHQMSIDGYRLIAQRSGQYAGQVGPYWCGEDGVWRDVWLARDRPPVAAKVGILRRGHSKPMWGTARFESYRQRSPMWDRMPDLMIAKCAEANGLRRAFPDELSGVYTQAETFDDGFEFEQSADVNLPNNVVEFDTEHSVTSVDYEDVEREAIQAEPHGHDDSNGALPRLSREVALKAVEAATIEQLSDVIQLRNQLAERGGDASQTDRAILDGIVRLLGSATELIQLRQLWQLFRSLPASIKTAENEQAVKAAGAKARKRIGGDS